MFRMTMIAVAGMLAFAPAHAQDKTEWCTDAHMQDMDAKLAAMADADKKKEAETHLQLSKDAMEKNNTEECIEHMEATHEAMGL